MRCEVEDLEELLARYVAFEFDDAAWLEEGDGMLVVLYLLLQLLPDFCHILHSLEIILSLLLVLYGKGSMLRLHAENF